MLDSRSWSGCGRKFAQWPRHRALPANHLKRKRNKTKRRMQDHRDRKGSRQGADRRPFIFNGCDCKLMKAGCRRVLYVACFGAVFLLPGPRVCGCLGKPPVERRVFNYNGKGTRQAVDRRPFPVESSGSAYGTAPCLQIT